jgi:hypothetical protein
MSASEVTGPSSSFKHGVTRGEAFGSLEARDAARPDVMGSVPSHETSRATAMFRTLLVLLSLQANLAMAETISFADEPIGAAPKGWTSTTTGEGSPKWSVENDPTTLSKVVKQSGIAKYPLLLKSSPSITDGFIEVRFKAIAGREDRAGGIVWRAKDANNYYVLRANALEDNVVMYKTVNGTRTALDIVGRKGGYGVKVAVPSGQWHALRAEFNGTRYKAFFNGRLLFEVDDSTLPEAGQIGLWTKADSVTVFDNFSYGSLP